MKCVGAASKPQSTLLPIWLVILNPHSPQVYTLVAFENVGADVGSDEGCDDGLDEGLELGWHEGIDDGCLYDKWR